MDELSHNIICLLAENDCVILPGIGGFIARRQPAAYDEAAREYSSPRRVVSFNRSLTMNDGLIVQSYMLSRGLNYPDASKLARQALLRLRAAIDRDGHARLEGLGMLVRGTGGTLSFEASGGDIPTPQYYGLPSVSGITPAESTAEPRDLHSSASRPSEAEDSPQQNNTRGSRRQSRKRNTLLQSIAGIAAALILFVLLTPSAHVSTPRPSALRASMLPSVTTPAPKQAAPSAGRTCAAPQPPASLNKTQAASALKARQTDSLAARAAKPRVGKKSQPACLYTIVLASAVSRKGAAAYVSHLHAAGYPDARISESGRMRRVVLRSYGSRDAALAALRAVRRQPFAADAWLMTVKPQPSAPAYTPTTD